LKEKIREQELTRTEEAGKIAKESGRGLKKGSENGTEECNAVRSRKSRMKSNNTEQCREPEQARAQKGREIPKKLTQKAKELSKLIPVTKLMYSRARTVI